MVNGLLNIYKEEGYTSFDVVAKLRGICHMKKIGHTGTLDPAAVGVLPVCLGSATKLCDMLTDHDKEYRAVMLLGAVSDTYDMTGVVKYADDYEDTDYLQKYGMDKITEVIKSFTGGYMQVPPMYSARKVDGKKLYELARAGITVERKAVWTDIYGIDIVDVQDKNKITIDVKCGRGTYIRSLIYDIGQKLTCGALMESLVRTRVGDFTIESALKLSEVEKLASEDRLCECVIPTEEVFVNLPRGIFSGCCDLNIYDKYVKNGNKLPAKFLDYAAVDKERIRIYDASGEFAGVYEYSKSDGTYKPYKLFLN